MDYQEDGWRVRDGGDGMRYEYENYKKVNLTYVKMLIQGVVRIGSRWVCGRWQNVIQHADNNDVGGMAAT